MTYTITLYKTYNPILGLFLNKKCKKVKGNTILKDIPGKMMIVYEDETKEIVCIDNLLGYKLSKELFTIISKQLQKESNGQVIINRD